MWTWSRFVRTQMWTVYRAGYWAWLLDGRPKGWCCRKAVRMAASSSSAGDAVVGSGDLQRRGDGREAAILGAWMQVQIRALQPVRGSSSVYLPYWVLPMLPRREAEEGHPHWRRGEREKRKGERGKGKGERGEGRGERGKGKGERGKRKEETSLDALDYQGLNSGGRHRVLGAGDGRQSRIRSGGSRQERRVPPRGSLAPNSRFCTRYTCAHGWPVADVVPWPVFSGRSMPCSRHQVESVVRAFSSLLASQGISHLRLPSGRQLPSSILRPFCVAC